MTNQVKSLNAERFQVGACYYPEHWTEELWNDDFRRMKEMGFSVVRVAEFAWSIFEPEEGKFEFGLFDRALGAAHQHGISVILGTPTATPPAWLTHKYPEVLNVSQNGVVYQHGQRRQYNYNAPIYRELSARIARQMAEHYKDHPAVIGWQIDNELNCEINVFYSEADHRTFREWLKVKYGSLDRLNAAWGAVFWNQTYSGWEQVHLTRPTVSDSPNPHQALDEKRFISDSAIAFAKLQADIIRELCPNHWVTTNGVFGHLDSHRMTEDLLDFISYDSYPNFSTIYPDKGEDPLLDRKWSLNLSGARDISSNFIVMEQQAGAGGWVNKMQMPSPKPGQMRLWTYQSIAHGADMILYFRWRTATVGTEIYWHGINDYHNRPNRRVAEAGQIGKELGQIGGRIVGTRYEADVAIVRDYDNEWDGELDQWHGPLQGKSTSAWFKALQYNHVPCDLVYLRDSSRADQLSKYKVLVYPHPAILTESAAKVLKAYVENGGTLIFGCRTGYKDKDGHCPMTPMPGYAAELCGISVEDFTLIGPNQPTPSVTLKGTSSGWAADAFNDILRVESDDVEVLAVYEDAYYAGAPALVRRDLGQGNVYYYGAAFNVESASALMREAGLSSPVLDRLALPKEVELSVRKNAATGEELLILLNYSGLEQKVEVKSELYDLLTSEKKTGTATLPPYGVFILSSRLFS
jgi:beta-galactosidase